MVNQGNHDFEVGKFSGPFPVSLGDGRKGEVLHVARDNFAAFEPLPDSDLADADNDAIGQDIVARAPRGLGVEVGARAAEGIGARSIEPEEMLLDEPHDRAAEFGFDAGELQLAQRAFDGGRRAIGDVDGKAHKCVLTANREKSSDPIGSGFRSLLAKISGSKSFPSFISGL